MSAEDIIGKEFIGMEFKSDYILTFNSYHKDMLESKIKVLNTNSRHTKYVNCETIINGKHQREYYPVASIIEQLEKEKNTPVDLDAIFRKPDQKTRFVVKIETLKHLNLKK